MRNQGDAPFIPWNKSIMAGDSAKKNKIVSCLLSALLAAGSAIEFYSKNGFILADKTLCHHEIYGGLCRKCVSER